MVEVQIVGRTVAPIHSARQRMKHGAIRRAGAKSRTSSENRIPWEAQSLRNPIHHRATGLAASMLIDLNQIARSIPWDNER
jgi:hypothetical protein